MFKLIFILMSVFSGYLSINMGQSANVPMFAIAIVCMFLVPFAAMVDVTLRTTFTR